MSAPATSRRGVISGEAGMLLAVVATLLRHEVVNYEWIAAGLILGSAIGVPLAMLMPMTHVPQRTAISQACGALASALIGTAEYFIARNRTDSPWARWRSKCCSASLLLPRV